MCPVNDGMEDTEHCLLVCNSFRQERYNLLNGANDILEDCWNSEGADSNILQILLYRNKNLPLETNKIILNFTMKCILEMKCFDWRLLESLKRAP